MLRIVTTIVALFYITFAQAHEWYPLECCSGVDCAKIEADTVRETKEGFVVTVAPGSHPMVKRSDPAQIYRIPYAQGRVSADTAYHLCIDHTKRMLCFFAPPGGV